MTTHSASVTLPDGSVKTYGRWGDSGKFVVYGRDAVAVRKGEPALIHQWCANERGARNALRAWQRRYGGEWTILTVAYTPERMLPPRTHGADA